MADERIARLPKWAQAHITKLQRERDSADAALHKMLDEQTPSKISYQNSHDMFGAPCFVQASKISIAHADVNLDVTLHDEDQIFLSWRPAGKNFAMGDICFIPTSYQQARLVHPKNASLSP